MPPSIAALDAELTDHVGIAPASLQTLHDLSKAVQDDPEDPIAASGLLDSLGNVIAALGHALWRGVKPMVAGRRGSNKCRQNGYRKMIDVAFRSPVFVADVEWYFKQGLVLHPLGGGSYQQVPLVAWHFEHDWLVGRVSGEPKVGFTHPTRPRPTQTKSHTQGGGFLNKWRGGRDSNPRPPA